MSDPIYNPSLRQVARNAKAPILPSSGESSILSWLESIGRLRTREPVEVFPDEAESEEISDLMGGDDSFEEEEEESDLAIDDDD